LIRPYRVATLENTYVRVDLAPELGGRIIRMIDRRTGHDVLRRPDPGQRPYPDVGGLDVAVYSDYLTARSYDATWELEPQAGPTELRLIGSFANGLKANRVLRLGKDALYLQTETTLENGGSTAVEAVLQSRCVAGLRDMKTSYLSIPRQDRGLMEQRLIEPGQEPRGSKVYDGSELPEGEWRVSDVGPDLSLDNRFPKDQVSRCTARWTGKTENSLSLGIWSAKRTLGPGEMLKLEADYGIAARIA